MQVSCDSEKCILLPLNALQSIIETHKTSPRPLGSVHCRGEPLLLSLQAVMLSPELPLYFGGKFGSTHPHPSVSSGGKIQQDRTSLDQFPFLSPHPINSKISFSFPPVLLDERPDVATWVTFLSFKKEWLKQGRMMVWSFFFYAKEVWAGSLPLTVRNGETSRSHTKTDFNSARETAVYPFHSASSP